jgi:hypothetical protein
MKLANISASEKEIVHIVAYSCFWLLLVAFGCFWLLLVAFGL